MGIRKHISHRYWWLLIHPCPCVTPITSVYIYLPLQAPGIYTHGATILCNAVRCLVGRYAKDALDTRYIFSTDCLHLSVLVTMLVTRAHTFSSHDTTVWNSVLVKINSLIRGGTAVDALLSHCLCQVSHALVCRSMMLVTISSGQCHHYQLYHCWPAAPAPRWRDSSHSDPRLHTSWSHTDRRTIFARNRWFLQCSVRKI